MTARTLRRDCLCQSPYDIYIACIHDVAMRCAICAILVLDDCELVHLDGGAHVAKGRVCYIASPRVRLRDLTSHAIPQQYYASIARTT